MYLLNYCDGVHDLCWIADKAGYSILELGEILKKLLSQGLLK